MLHNTTQAVSLLTLGNSLELFGDNSGINQPMQFLFSHTGSLYHRSKASDSRTATLKKRLEPAADVARDLA